MLNQTVPEWFAPATAAHRVKPQTSPEQDGPTTTRSPSTTDKPYRNDWKLTVGTNCARSQTSLVREAFAYTGHVLNPFRNECKQRAYFRGNAADSSAQAKPRRDPLGHSPPRHAWPVPRALFKRQPRSNSERETHTRWPPGLLPDLVGWTPQSAVTALPERPRSSVPQTLAMTSPTGRGHASSLSEWQDTVASRAPSARSSSGACDRRHGAHRGAWLQANQICSQAHRRQPFRSAVPA